MKHRMRIWLASVTLATLAVAQDDALVPSVAEQTAPRFVLGTAPTGLGAAGQAMQAPRSKRQAHVEVDEATRTLIITTDPATDLQIQDVIRALDKPVPQALIKVLFLEVTHTDDLDVGVDATRTHISSDGSRTSAVASLFGVASETRGGIVSILQADLEVTMRALAEVGRLNVLSRPSILARNNQEATITIGQEVPFIRNSRITDDGQTINTVEYEDIGIILTVTPRIGADGLIEMDVAPEISTLTGETVAISDTINAPVFAKRSAETHVVVPSGKTVIIGGLMEDQETSSVRKVPLLGDIPLLGALFRRKVTTKQKTELLIFLTPTIVTDGSGLVDVTQREKQNATLIQRSHGQERLERYMGQDTAPTATP